MVNLNLGVDVDQFLNQTNLAPNNSVEPKYWVKAGADSIDQDQTAIKGAAWVWSGSVLFYCSRHLWLEVACSDVRIIGVTLDKMLQCFRIIWPNTIKNF